MGDAAEKVVELQQAEHAGQVKPKLRVHTLADIYKAIGDVEWIWDEWMPDKMLTVIAARAGVGKTRFVINALVAPLLRPDLYTLPDGTEFDPGHNRTRKVLWLDTESGAPIVVEVFKELELPLEGLIVPAFPEAPDDPLAAGGVPLNNEAWQKVMLDTIEQERPGLVVIDSLTGGADLDLNTGDVKKILKPLAHTAEKTRTPTALIHHGNKPKPGKPEGVFSINDLTGHNSIQGFARSIILLDVPDDNDPEHIRVRIGKSNLTAKPWPERGAHINPKLEWTDEAPRGRETRQLPPVLASTVEWLAEDLKDGPRQATEVCRMADLQNISRETLKRAKKHLEVQSVKTEGEHGPWFWQLPKVDDCGDDEVDLL